MQPNEVEVFTEPTEGKIGIRFGGNADETVLFTPEKAREWADETETALNEEGITAKEDPLAHEMLADVRERAEELDGTA